MPKHIIYKNRKKKSIDEWTDTIKGADWKEVQENENEERK